jgi:hypothetical protein
MSSCLLKPNNSINYLLLIISALTDNFASHF